jgi:hypothetical protein
MHIFASGFCVLTHGKEEARVRDESGLALREEVRSDIAVGLDPMELVAVYLPRMEQALEMAQTPQEINEIRSQIETVTTYLRRELPKINRNRGEQFKYTHEADMLYLKASAKAGKLWKACDDRRGRGGDGSNQHQRRNCQSFDNSVSWLEVGFKSRQDVMDCERLAQLHEEDWRTYEEETLTNMRQPTIHGGVNVWRMVFGSVEQGDTVGTAEPMDLPLVIILDAIRAKDGEWLLSEAGKFYFQTLDLPYEATRLWAEGGCLPMETILCQKLKQAYTARANHSEGK